MFMLLYVCLWAILHTTSCYMPGMVRKLEKNGFHREIHSTVMITEDVLPIIPADAETRCQVLIKELIPSGAYVDPFQLASLKNFGGPDFLLTDHVDVEQQEYQSREFNLYIYGNLTRTQEGWSCGYILPIHLRYHAVMDRDYTTVSFENPEVSLRCSNNDQGNSQKGAHGTSSEVLSAPCDSRYLHLCKWTRVHYETLSKEIQIPIPVGLRGHHLLVTFGTLFATLSGCLILGYKTVSQNNKEKAS